MTFRLIHFTHPHDPGGDGAPPSIEPRSSSMSGTTVDTTTPPLSTRVYQVALQTQLRDAANDDFNSP